MHIIILDIMHTIITKAHGSDKALLTCSSSRCKQWIAQLHIPRLSPPTCAVGRKIGSFVEASTIILGASEAFHERIDVGSQPKYT